MEAEKPKQIKRVGLTVALVSGLLLLVNTLGYLMSFYLASTSEGTDNSMENTLPAQEFLGPQLLALMATLLSLTGLLAGIFIMRYKNWARVLAQATALLLLAFTWFQALYRTGDNAFSQGNTVAANMAYALVWSALLALLWWYLQQRHVRRHFE